MSTYGSFPVFTDAPQPSWLLDLRIVVFKEQAADTDDVKDTGSSVYFLKATEISIDGTMLNWTFNASAYGQDFSFSGSLNTEDYGEYITVDSDGVYMVIDKEGMMEALSEEPVVDRDVIPSRFLPIIQLSKKTVKTIDLPEKVSYSYFNGVLNFTLNTDTRDESQEGSSASPDGAIKYINGSTGDIILDVGAPLVVSCTTENRS